MDNLLDNLSRQTSKNPTLSRQPSKNPTTNTPKMVLDPKRGIKIQEHGPIQIQTSPVKTIVSEEKQRIADLENRVEQLEYDKELMREKMQIMVIEMKAVMERLNWVTNFITNPEAVNITQINTITEEDSRSAGDHSRSYISEKGQQKKEDVSKGTQMKISNHHSISEYDSSLSIQQRMQRVQSQNQPVFLNKLISKSSSSNPNTFVNSVRHKESFSSSLRAVQTQRTEFNIQDEDIDSSDQDDSQTVVSKPDELKKKQSVDLAFLHADVLVQKKADSTLGSLSQEQTLSADNMYNQIVKQLWDTKKRFSIMKRALNKSELKKSFILFKPKVLFLNCHGGFHKNKESQQINSYFCFEQEKVPTLQEECDEQSLKDLVQTSQVSLVVISACHSSRLGQILIEAGVPVVISIQSSAQVLEEAAEKFNKEFLCYLLNGSSPKDAFEAGLSVLASDKQTSKICCCSHDHTADCLWLKFQELYPENAHSVHESSCKCFMRPNYGPIDHQYDCIDWKRFYSQLLSTDEFNLELLLQKNGENGFLMQKIELAEQLKGKFNKMCCCQSHKPHNESQKFIIMGQVDAQNKPLFDKNSRLDGEVRQDLPIDFKSLPNWLRQESSWLFDRNIDIHTIVEFLCSDKRMLQIFGKQMSGRTAVVNRAIKIVLARDKSRFKDGVFMVDLENVSDNALVEKITSSINLINPQPREDSLIRDLIGGKRLIVFSDCKRLQSKQLQKGTLNFIKKIITQTNDHDTHLKFIFIMKEKKHGMQFDWDQSMTIEPMTKKGKFQLFCHLMKLQGKAHLMKNKEKLKNHEIFDIIDPQWITRIVHEYVDDQSLDKLQQDLKQKIESEKLTNKKKRNQNDERNLDQQVIMRSIYCKNLLKEVPTKYESEKNLIFFLTLTPAGISEVEARQLCTIYKKWFGTQFQLLENLPLEQSNKSALQEESKDASKAIVNEQQSESYLDLVQVSYYKDIGFILKVNKDHMKGLEMILSITNLILKDNQQKDKKDLLSIVIEFMGSQARSLLRSIKRKDFHDYQLVTAHLDCGMWWRYPNEEEAFDIEIQKAEQRFSAFYLTNFKYLLNQEMLNENFPNIWSKDQISHESEYIFDLCLTVPSILVQLRRYGEAEELIKECRKFGGKETLLLHGYLDLMLASIKVQNQVLHQDLEVLKLLQSARQHFKKNYNNPDQQDDQSEYVGHIEGRAETYFVEALYYMNVFKKQINENPNIQLKFKSQSISNSEIIITEERYHRFNSSGSLQSKATSEDLVGYDLYRRPRDSMDIVNLISEALNEAFKSFEMLDDGFQGSDSSNPDDFQIKISNKLFGKAKTKLAEADFFINCYSSISAHQLQKCGFTKDSQLESLLRAEQLFKERSSMARDITDEKPGTESQAQSSKNYEAMAICLQAKLKMLPFDSKSLTQEEVKDARTTIDRACALKQNVDDFIYKEINDIKNKVLHEMRYYSNNLLTFAKAWPLVEKLPDGKIISIGDFTTSRFELKPDIETALLETGLDLQIKFDFLNEELLKNVIETGSRVLHLSSDIFSRDCLYIEDKIGICKKIQILQIADYIQSFKIGKNGNKLPVDCMVIAIPDSSELGKCFAEQGVQHVVAFDLIQNYQNNEIESQLMPIRYNYIYTFCQRFYICLVQQKTVRESFNLALEDVNNKDILEMKIWDYKEFKFYDLGIKPILIDEKSRRHDQKLFNTQADSKEREYCKQGRLYETTKPRGLLVGMKKSFDPLIGQKKNLHYAMAALTNSQHPVHLVHVQAKRGVGKTKFIQEVAYYLYQRGMFSFKIQYQDLKKIQTEQAFYDMLQDKNLYDEERYKVKLERNPVQTLLVFDNIESLPQEIAKRFEARLIDLIKSNSGLRFLTSSTKKFSFQQFCDDKEILTNTKPKFKMVLINLKPLCVQQAVDLLLSACPREITKGELDMDSDYENHNTIHSKLEDKIALLGGRPSDIKDLAKKLEDHKFWQIHITVKQDKMKNQHNHHLAKRKSITFSIENKYERQPSQTSSNFNRRNTYLQPNYNALPLPMIQSGIGVDFSVYNDSSGQRTRTNSEAQFDVPIEERKVNAHRLYDQLAIVRGQSTYTNIEEYFPSENGQQEILEDHDKDYYDYDEVEMEEDHQPDEESKVVEVRDRTYSDVSNQLGNQWLLRKEREGIGAERGQQKLIDPKKQQKKEKVQRKRKVEKFKKKTKTVYFLKVNQNESPQKSEIAEEEIDEEHTPTMPLKQISMSSSASPDSTTKGTIQSDASKHSGNKKKKKLSKYEQEQEEEKLFLKKK